MRGATVRVGAVALTTAVGLLAVAGCAQDDESAQARVDGEQAYEVECWYCHDVPDGIGTEITAEVLASYSSLGSLRSYLEFAMPHQAPGSLAADDYEAILVYLISSRGLVADDADPWSLPDSTTLRVPSTPAAGGL